MLSKIEKFLGVILISLMFLLILIQIFNRIFFHLSIPWTEEGARYVFAWLVFIGASYAIKTESHIGIEAFVNLLPEKGQKICKIIMYFLFLIFVGILAFYGIKLICLQYNMHQLTPALRLPMFIPYMSIPFGSILMIIRICQKLYVLLWPNKQKQQLCQ